MDWRNAENEHEELLYRLLGYGLSRFVVRMVPGDNVFSVSGFWGSERLAELRLAAGFDCCHVGLLRHDDLGLRVAIAYNTAVKFFELGDPDLGEKLRTEVARKSPLRAWRLAWEVVA